MIHFVVYERATGNIVGFGTSPTWNPAVIVQPGCDVLQSSKAVSQNTHRVDIASKSLIPYSNEGRARRALNRPGLTWDCVAEDWIYTRTLDERKAAMWSEVKRQRAHAFDAPASSAAGIPYRITKDKDNLAGEIDGRDAGQVPEHDITLWKGEDNQFYPLDRAGLATFAFDMRERGKSIYAHSWTIDADITNAQSAEELNAIDTGAGWP